MTAAGVTAGGEAPAEACAPARDNPFDSEDSISPMVKTVSPSKTLEVRCVFEPALPKVGVLLHSTRTYHAFLRTR